MNWIIPLTILLTPTYVIKVNIFGLPGNLLMLWVFLVWLTFGIYILKNNLLTEFFASIKNNSKKNWVWIFLLGATISLFFSGLSQKTLGEYLVFFVQPVSLYFIAKFLLDKYPGSKYFIPYTLYLILALAGLYATLQYFLNINLPLLFQGNDYEPRRAVSFFVHPNFYALWAAPLLAFLLPDLFESIKYKVLSIKYLKIIAWVIGAFGLLLSLSRAGWFGLFVAIIFYIFIAADKKIRSLFYYTAVVAIVFALFIPSIRHRLTSPFNGEKSASSRITLWQSGIKAIKQSPIFGLGLGGYSRDYRQLITDQTLPDHNFPHNVFLDLWVETGIIGLIGLIGLISSIIYNDLRDKKDIFKLSVALFLIALLVQGQIDNPYLKNDLAAIFWIVLAML